MLSATASVSGQHVQHLFFLGHISWTDFNISGVIYFTLFVFVSVHVFNKGLLEIHIHRKSNSPCSCLQRPP